ncbi:hypothetical protein CASFOL_018799 [Castilleja foliolosa]|uniref:Uncharacterized protein n=1 Tax=Castilleja foliolosa TaxID=1961234 RepID=A0ABD3BYF0_9LAMI
MIPSKHILPVARPDPEVVAMLTSGLTTSIALEKVAEMSKIIALLTAKVGIDNDLADADALAHYVRAHEDDQSS